jgi:hypothetical protein
MADLRGTIKLTSEQETSFFLQPGGEDEFYKLKVFQTGLPQSEEEELIGTLFLFKNGETKFVESRSQD